MTPDGFHWALLFEGMERVVAMELAERLSGRGIEVHVSAVSLLPEPHADAQVWVPRALLALALSEAAAPPPPDFV